MKYAYSYKLKRLPLEVVVIEGVVSNEVAVMSLKELPKEPRMFNMARTIDKTIIELKNINARKVVTLIEGFDNIQHPVFTNVDKFIEMFIAITNGTKENLEGRKE